MSDATDLRADAYAAGITGLVDAHVAARLLCDPPSPRVAVVDVVLTVTCGALALASLSTPWIASPMGALCVSGIFSSVESVRAYRRERRKYLDAVRVVVDAFAKLRGAQ